MNKFTTFESSIIGLFVGVIAATYLEFLYSMGGFVSKILAAISLLPVFEKISANFSADPSYLRFIFVVVVYVVYGAVIGLLVKISKIQRKQIYVSVVVVTLMLTLIVLEQISGTKELRRFEANKLQQTAVVANVIKKQPQQYFGIESHGDLNSDGSEDVAFIISRDDNERGTLYYLATALKESNGHHGTNLIFLGNKIVPQKISIENGVISINCEDNFEKETKIINKTAKVENGVLVEIKE